MSARGGNYAVILGREEVSAACGTGFGYAYGACFVSGGDAEVRFFADRDALEEAVKDVACCPSGYGASTALPPFEAEAEAIAAICDAAMAAMASDGQKAEPSRAAVRPAGFERWPAAREGGFRVRATAFGVDFEASDAADAAGWREGDRVSLSVSPCGSMAAISPDPAGVSLERNMSSPEALSPDRDLTGLPPSFPFHDGRWEDARWCLDGRSVVFPLPFPPPATDGGVRTDAWGTEPWTTGGTGLRGFFGRLNRRPSRHIG